VSTIELRHVTKRFGSFTAVDDISLFVAPGEVVCLLGPSGCGKTTTLRIIAGLERASAGDVNIAGKRMNELKPEQRDIAMVFQFYALYPALTVGENIMFPLHRERLSASEAAARVTKVADLLHLQGVLDRLPSRISEGERQRVAVARAVVRDPNCFLFDEPLSRLDVELRQSMRGQIKGVLTALSKATVIVTHDQLEALTMADRIAIMRDGRIEQASSPHSVFAKPANVFVASFIGTPQMNLIEAEFEGMEEARGSFAVDGRRLRLEVDPAVGRLAKGKVTLGIRPRAFFLHEPTSSDTLIGQAELIEPMGAETLVHARTQSGNDIRVVVPREDRVHVGERLHLKTDARQTHVFDATGKAVRQ
jgi:multiple sugar transport system ATP-binding protein